MMSTLLSLSEGSTFGFGEIIALEEMQWIVSNLLDEGLVELIQSPEVQEE